MKKLYDYYFFPYQILRTGCEVVIDGKYKYWDNTIVFDKTDMGKWRKAYTMDPNIPHALIDDYKDIDRLELVYLESSDDPTLYDGDEFTSRALYKSVNEYFSKSNDGDSEE